MKVNFKKIGVEVETDAESIIEKGINAHENDWKEKLLLIAEESIFGCGIADFRRKEKG